MEIMVPASQSIALNTVIVLEVVNYAPTSTTTITAQMKIWKFSEGIVRLLGN
ncbi:hypothetical protein J31TS6_10240 [Brevibacillus reuszeri]|uniref:hypothetical protein n=1 Tax=Brevibacillus reuszeri TaxID=54915 RepID=UPI001B11C820|nr:hypothetical protein [Brevibacillus reuszeri]GIO04996.1 hypothetical protein J31TS6_10240 [Brevibacillus reuszeri]